MTSHILTSFADNEALTKAVRDLLEACVTNEHTNLSLSNSELGEVMRARLTALEAIDTAFRQIERYKTTKPSETGGNPAR